jgi:NAD(P)H-dependent nitrite reductase small subunit
MNVCPVDRLIEGRGVCVKVDGRAIAVFLVGDRLFAIDNTDPFSGASVLSRGLVGVVRGDAGLVHYVASPLRKQRFCLETGRCLDDDTRSVQTHEVAVIDGAVILRSDAHRAITAVKPR